MEDGSDVPQNVAIERFCGGNSHIEGHADARGNFSFEIGSRSTDAFQDASTSDFSQNQSSAGVPGQQLLNCEIRARLAGYQSQTVDLTSRRVSDSPDIGIILMHRIAPTEGTTVSATSLTAPKKARKAVQDGLNLVRKHKNEQAIASFQRAVDLDPKYAEAWLDLGKLQAAQGQPDAARRSFEASIRSDSQYVPPYIQISVLELNARRWQQLADVTDHAARLDPFSFPETFYLNAVARFNLHQVEAAERSARKAQDLDTRHRIPQASRLLGTILAQRRDFAAAAAAFRDYVRFAPQAKDATAVRGQAEAFERQAAER
jgi:Flp pilus assembly protein TadD